MQESLTHLLPCSIVSVMPCQVTLKIANMCHFQALFLYVCMSLLQQTITVITITVNQETTRKLQRRRIEVFIQPFLRHVSFNKSFKLSKPLTFSSAEEGNSAIFRLLVMWPLNDIIYLKMLCSSQSSIKQTHAHLF